MKQKAQSKTIIITGAGHFPGIGAETSKYLLDQGHTLVINSRSFDPIWHLHKKIYNDRLELVAGDVTDSKVQDALIDISLAKTTRIDALVNNASTGKAEYDQNKCLTNTSWKENFELNVIVPYDFSMKVKEYLTQTKGSIINISSRAALHISSGNNLAYATSKSAMNRMSLGLAREFSPDISVNVICPGLVESHRLQKILGDRYQDWVDAYKRFSASGKPVDTLIVAKTIETLIEDPSITGQVIPMFDVVDQ